MNKLNTKLKLIVFFILIIIFFLICVLLFYISFLKPTWKISSCGTSPYSDVIFSEDKLYFGSEDSYLYCVKALDGSIPWKFKTQREAVPCGCTIEDSFLYFGSKDSYIYCLDKNTSKLIWKYDAGSWVEYIFADERNVYVYSSNNYLTCLDNKTGNLLWRFKPENAIAYFPIIKGNLVYLSDGSIYCINTKDGKEIFKTELDLPIAQFVYYEDRLYIPGFDKLYVVDANYGKVILEIDYLDNFNRNVNQIVVFEDKIYVLDWSGFIYNISPEDGKIIKSSKRSLNAFSIIATRNGKLYVSTKDNKILIINSTTLEKIKSYNFEDKIYALFPIDFHGNKLFVRSYKGTIYCLEIKD